MGRSTWLYDGASTIEVGLIGPGYTRDNGFRTSSFSGFNEVGQVVGQSARYEGNSYLGTRSWMYDGTTTTQIGLIGPEFVNIDGSTSSSPLAFISGKVLGASNRFDDTFHLGGTSIWIYDGTATVEIGLTGPSYTRADGYRSNSTASNTMNANGQVIGTAQRFLGSEDQGRTAWLYDGSTTREIGLIGGEHVLSNGYRLGDAELLSESGKVAGYATRFNSGGGISAWTFDGATTIAIGLTGSEHTRNDGYRSSLPVLINEAGHVAGRSLRFDGALQIGASAWLYDGVDTRNIGLTGPEYTDSQGRRNSVVAQMNDAGYVVGHSDRHVGGNGSVAWLYDPTLQQTVPMLLEVSSGGFADSDVWYLGEDGLVLGSYYLADSLNGNYGDRAFSYTSADGLRDLGALIDGGLSVNGWELLANAVRANRHGQVFGNGRLSSQPEGQMVYLLTRVPEPSALCMLLLGVMAIELRRRR